MLEQWVTVGGKLMETPINFIKRNQLLFIFSGGSLKI